MTWNAWILSIFLFVSFSLPQDTPPPKKAGPQDGKGKKAGKQKEPPKPGALAEKADPTGRPEGSIVKKPARYYIFFEKEKWHVRTCAQKKRRFDGTITIKNGTVKSSLNVGINRDNKKKNEEGFNVDKDRTKITFHYDTSTRSDGFDFTVEGDDAIIEIDLKLDGQTMERKSVFLGKAEHHPPVVPFSLKANPVKKE